MDSLKKIKILIFSLLFMIGCASAEKELIPVISMVPETPEEIRRATEIWKKVDERNRTIEDNPEWINNAYDGIKIKSLSSIPMERYEGYKKFLDAGKVYIINHPAFYAFFQHPKIDRKNDSLSKNIVDMLLKEENAPVTIPDGKDSAGYNKKVIKTLLEFERVGRNFLEFKSAEQKLVILILPGDYKKYSIYRYKDGPDEYARYINDVTNMSESILYFESKKPNQGQLIDEDLNTLIDFLHKIGATSIMLGGEYIGRCEEDLFKQLSETIGSTIGIEIVPELSPVSPDDMNKEMTDLLTPDNKLDIRAATSNILNDKYNKLEVTPKISNLRSRMSYEKPDK